MKNKVDDVRNHLVQVMEALNEENLAPEDLERTIERAKAMSSLATSYVNAVKVELDAIRLADEVGMLPGSINAPTEVKRQALSHGPRRINP
jgi:hypothetical protein